MQSVIETGGKVVVVHVDSTSIAVVFSQECRISPRCYGNFQRILPEPALEPQLERAMTAQVGANLLTQPKNLKDEFPEMALRAMGYTNGITGGHIWGSTVFIEITPTSNTFQVALELTENLREYYRTLGVPNTIECVPHY